MNTVQSFYKKPRYMYKRDLDITRSCYVFQFFYHEILQRNYMKRTMTLSYPKSKSHPRPLRRHGMLSWPVTTCQPGAKAGGSNVLMSDL